MAHQTQQRLFLIDGMAIAYRAHFAFISRPIRTSKGMNASAVFGFVNTLIDLMKTGRPTHLAVAFDTSAPTARHEEFPAYKAQREAMPEDLSAALPYVRKMVEAFSIPVLAIDGYEADDVIGTLAKRAEKEGWEVYMVTPDKDFAQLVSEHVRIWKPGRQGAEHEVLGVAEICEQWQIQRTEQVIDILGLWGDSVDNIPGIPGIGEKTAKSLIQQFGSVEKLLASADQLKGKQKENVIHFADQARLSKKLATIMIEVPLTATLDDLAIRPIDEEAVKGLLVELEFNQLGKRLFGGKFTAGRGYQEPQTEAPLPQADAGLKPQSVVKTLAEVPHAYRVAKSEADVKLVLAEAIGAGGCAVCIDASAGHPSTSQLLGVALAWKDQEAAYIPCGASLPKPLAEFLENPDVPKIGYDLKRGVHVLLWNGCRMAGGLEDVMIAQALLDPEQKYSLTYLSEAYLGRTPMKGGGASQKETAGQMMMLETDNEGQDRVDKAMEEADLCRQLMAKLRPKLQENGASHVFADIEAPLIPVLAGMERVGVKVDVTVLREVGTKLDGQIKELETSIYELAGGNFNLNSPKQLGQILFEKLRLVEKPKKTKTGQYMTGEEVLAELAGIHPIVAKLLDYREASKLRSTYVEALPQHISPRSGRVHTNYQQVMTATGRLASNDPNLQNIPIRTEQGKEIRRAFVAGGEDLVLLSADYNQIELRVMAALSKDPGMVEAFRSGLDIHRATAAKVFGLPPAEVTSEMRRSAKMVNFGIIYGISAFGLAQRLGVPRSEAARLIDEYFIQYPGIKEFMDSTIRQAGAKGYVETITGRRRILRDIKSANATVRKSAERMAINTPIQGSSADMIKIAMVHISRRLERECPDVKMLLQVHDELVFECRESRLAEAQVLIRQEMEKAIPLPVPVIIDFGHGKNWKVAH